MILFSIFVFVNLRPLALLGEGGEAGIDKQLASFRIVAKHSGQYLEINSILRIISREFLAPDANIPINGTTGLWDTILSSLPTQKYI